MLRLAALFLFTVWASAVSFAEDRPNILVILTDDQGYGDVSAHGNPVLKTPALDGLWAESARFTDFMVSPTCAPTRAALLTGRHEFRNGVTHTISERERLTPDAVTLAEVLRAAGYRTGIFGKWHLGDENAYQPGKRGFDEAFIHGGGGIGQSYAGSCGDAPRNRYFDPVIRHNGTFVRTKGYCTDVFFRQAEDWIGSDGGDARPFFCWLALNAPHAPLDVKPEDRAVYEGKGLSALQEKFFGMLHNIDRNTGALLDILEKRGLGRNTLVIFMNDNGGTVGADIFNDGMRGEKCSPWRGGTRAMSFWRLPGTIPPGDRPGLTAHIDVFRTLAELARAPLSPKTEAQAEGRSLVPLLKDPAAPWSDRVLFTHVGRWPRWKAAEAKYSWCAVRNTRYTLVSPDDSPSPAWQLYDLQDDPGQRNDIAMKRPEEVAKLAAAYDEWWAGVAPGLVNEATEGPDINPFAAAYWKQFGGEPTPEEVRTMRWKSRRD